MKDVAGALSFKFSPRPLPFSPALITPKNVEMVRTATVCPTEIAFWAKNYFNNLTRAVYWLTY